MGRCGLNLVPNRLCRKAIPVQTAGVLRAPLALRLFCGRNYCRRMIRLRIFEKMLRRPPYA
ncbi:hypothetical protein HMPREF9554_02631 [Treponema phagedenis F0421]|nr:hypothetical protein HMPREF9554_02631 [Treponema phagedenis F0421]